MKKARFLNSVGKKYIVGYVIVAVFFSSSSYGRRYM